MNKGIADNVIPETMRKSLEEDVFVFSALKTHAQLFEASRQLLQEDGTRKPFYKFSRDVESIKTNYNQNYLQAEYQFANSSAQQAAKWAEVEENQGRYDIQYRTAKDDRVRDSHEKLHGITLPASDDFWNEYYPPNGWRCRCVAIEVLKGKYPVSDPIASIEKGQNATSKIGKDGKNRLEIFRFNPGKEKVIFPPNHPYRKVQDSGQAVELTKASIVSSTLGKRYKDIPFKIDENIKKGVLEVFTKGKQHKVEFTKNKKALTILTDSNEKYQYRILPIIKDGKSNPDAFNLTTNKFVDIKVPDGISGINIVHGALKEASRQGAKEVIIHLTQKPDSYRNMYIGLQTVFKLERADNVNFAIVIFPDGSIKEYNLKKLRVEFHKKYRGKE